MYQDFRIITIQSDIKTKTITVNTSFDVDPATVNESAIQLYERATRNYIDLDFDIRGKDIVLTLSEWPQPNIEYVIAVQDLKNVLGDPLVSGARRKIIFESSIVSRLNITYPAFNEVINDLIVEWEEVPADNVSSLVGLYYIEISTDNAFHNIVRSVNVIDGRTSIDIADIPRGQYYVRGRVQKDNEYGLWSETITFLVDTEALSPDPIFDDNEDGEPDVIYIQDIELLSSPVNGETPATFMLEFDYPIDPASLSNIVVMRRKI